MPGIRIFCLMILLLARSAIAAPTYPFLVETEKTNDGHRIVARNQGPSPVSVRVAMPMAVNITPDRPFPVYAVVPPNGQIIIGSVRATIPGVSYSFQTQNTHILGNFNARQHPDVQYRLPVRDGQVARIDQAAGGRITTHTNVESQYAVDIPLPEGTPIIAARDGMVIAAEAGESEGGKRQDLLTKANVVRILHFDGTIAEYAHLAPGGVFVYPGQRVAAGDEIGLAGSTGYSSGPHLHFAVTRIVRTPDGFAVESVPFHFYVGTPAKPFVPRQGMEVRADYSAGASLQMNASTTPSLPGHGESTVSGPSSQSGIYLEVPRLVTEFFARTPTWQLVAGSLALLILFVAIGKETQKRRRQQWEHVRFTEPVWTPPQTIRTAIDLESAIKRLKTACCGNEAILHRLIQVEMERDPTLTREEAAADAMLRLRRDRD